MAAAHTLALFPGLAVVSSLSALGFWNPSLCRLVAHRGNCLGVLAFSTPVESLVATAGASGHSS